MKRMSNAVPSVSSADGRYLRFSVSSRAGSPVAYMSLRDAGDMGKGAGLHNSNRCRFFSELGVVSARVKMLNQVHSRIVYSADIDMELSHCEGDGLVSCDKGVLLAVTVADCMPILLFDEKTGCFGILHSGWKGTGILEDALVLMQRRHGSDPKNLRVVLGPCIGSCCYAVDEHRAKLFRERWGDKAVRTDGASMFIDMKAANKAILAKQGVLFSDINVCTCCDPRFGSYRREGSGAFTRMLVLFGYMKEHEGD